MINSNDTISYTLIIHELIARVNDTHASVWEDKLPSGYFGKYFAPFSADFIENKAVVTYFNNNLLCKETGIKIGDVISKIDDKPIDRIINERLKYVSASNYSTKLREISWGLLKTKDSTMNLEIVRNGNVTRKTITTYTGKEVNPFKRYQVKDTCFKMINEKIAYINHHTLTKKHLSIIWKNIEKSKGLIIDIRNYPEGSPLDELSSYLYPNKKEFVKFTNGSLVKPGQYAFIRPESVGKYNENYYKGKVVILVNEITQSSSEYHTMAYSQSPNAIVIGSTTAGADGNISQFKLPGGIWTAISGIGVYYLDGRETQRVGILPDIEVKPSILGVQQGRDEILEKAIEIITNN